MPILRAERDEKQVAEVVDSDEMSKLSYNMLWKPRAICSTYTREYAWFNQVRKQSPQAHKNPSLINRLVLPTEH